MPNPVVVKRYFGGQMESSDGVMVDVRETEISDWADITQAHEQIFIWKMAGVCDGYEIIDLPDTEAYHELRRSAEGTDVIQSLIQERWYDKQAIVSKMYPGASVSQLMQNAHRIKAAQEEE